MNSLDRTDLYWNLFRLVGGGGLFVVSLLLLYWAQRDIEPHFIVLGAGALVISGKVLAPMVAEQLSGLASFLYVPGAKLSKPPPAYSKARGHRAFYQYEEALAALWELIAQHPQELEAWKELIEITLLDLRDPARARSIFMEGRRTLKRQERVKLLEEAWSTLGARAVALGIREPARDAEGREPAQPTVMAMPSQEELDQTMAGTNGKAVLERKALSQRPDAASFSDRTEGVLNLPSPQPLNKTPDSNR